MCINAVVVAATIVDSKSKESTDHVSMGVCVCAMYSVLHTIFESLQPI